MRKMQIKESKKKKERKVRIAKIQRAVLYALAAAGGLGMAAVAPNTLRVLQQCGWVKTKRHFRSTVNRSMERLEKAKFVSKDQSGLITLTTTGEKRLAELKRADYQLEISEKWDGKWRIVSFDIKERRRNVREQLRLTLQAVGFVHLHHSVWVYPHDCEDFLSLLKADYHIGVEVLYIIADYIENDGWLRRHFRLDEYKV